VGFQPNDPGDHQFGGPGIQIPAAAPKNRSRTPGGFGGLCREEQLLLRFFGEGLCQVKLISASLAIRGAEWNRQPFF